MGREGVFENSLQVIGLGFYIHMMILLEKRAVVCISEGGGVNAVCFLSLFCLNLVLVLNYHVNFYDHEGLLPSIMPMQIFTILFNFELTSEALAL